MHTELRKLLQKRLDVIADHEFRDRDSEAHLQALIKVSEDISAYAQSHLAELDAKLRHYLTNSSFQKALDHLG